MKLPLLEHAGLYITNEYLSKNPPEPVSPSKVDFDGYGAEPDYSRIGESLSRIMQTHSAPQESDGAVARAIHESLPLTRREASEMRFWHYLTAVKFPDYVSWRYFDPRTGKTNRNRYTGLLDVNSLSRLWWFADLTISHESVDPYWRTEKTAVSLEFIKGIVQNLFGGNRFLVNGIADILFNGHGKPPDQLVDQMFIQANVLLVSVAIDALEKEEVDKIVQQLYFSASHQQA